MDYFELPVPKTMEGKSMLAQIYDPSVKINDAVFTEFTRYEVDHDGFGGLQMMRAITTKRYKLVIHLLDTDEFYDLETDPYEVENRINDEAYEAVRNELHDKLLAHMDDTRDLYRGYQWKMRPWRKMSHQIGIMVAIQDREKTKNMSQDSLTMTLDFLWKKQ